MTPATLLRKSQQLALKRSNGKCEVCGWFKPDLQAHHRRPRGSGGTSLEWVNSPANLLIACSQCHAKIESQREWAKANGYLLSLHSRDASRPVRYWWQTPLNAYREGWAILTNTGEAIELPGPVPSERAA